LSYELDSIKDDLQVLAEKFDTEEDSEKYDFKRFFVNTFFS
jgi:hypothetical protein